jgi:hypothetical protein
MKGEGEKIPGRVVFFFTELHSGVLLIVSIRYEFM